MGGFILASATNSFCLLTEANWQRLGPSRALITAITRRAKDRLLWVFWEVVAIVIGGIILDHFVGIRDLFKALLGGGP
jgi:hypothetical protein